MGRKLSTAYGASGKSRAFAHYESYEYAIINITKPHAASGSFAHEFGHAIDNLAAVFTKYQTDGFGQYVSGGLSGRFQIDAGRLNSSNKFVSIMEQIFKILYYDDNNNLTKFAITLKEIGETAEYWKRRTEVFARTFETWVNYRLGSPTNKMFYKSANEYKNSAYPDTKLIKKIDNLVFDFCKNIIEFLNGAGTDNLKFETPKTQQAEEFLPETNYEFSEAELELLQVFINKKTNKITTDDIIDNTTLSMPEINSLLFNLELNDIVNREVGNQIKLKVNLSSLKKEAKKQESKIKTESKPDPKVEGKVKKKSNIVNGFLSGDQTDIVTPSEILKGKFAIIEMEKLIPSNDPFTFSHNDKYPQTCQTRSYKEDQSENNYLLKLYIKGQLPRLVILSKIIPSQRPKRLALYPITNTTSKQICYRQDRERIYKRI